MAYLAESFGGLSRCKRCNTYLLGQTTAVSKERNKYKNKSIQFIVVAFGFQPTLPRKRNKTLQRDTKICYERVREYSHI